MPRKPWNRADFAQLVPTGAIGMVHLPPLPGSPGWKGDMAAVRRAAQTDLEALVAGGFGAVMVENYHDVPFHPGRVPAETVAAMAGLLTVLKDSRPAVALGVNVLRNDVASALAVAAACGADFVRVNVHIGAAVTDQGTIEGRAWETLRLRRALDLEHVGILADLRVKHAHPVAPRPLEDEALDLRLRGMADGIILTGVATGSPADPGQVAQMRALLPDCPLLVGSGLRVDSLGGFFPAADGGIVGSSLKDDASGPEQPPVSVAKATRFMQTLAEIRGKGQGS